MQGALEWLEKYQDKSMDEIAELQTEAADATDPHAAATSVNPGEDARSFVCNDCGVKLRSHAQMEFHATKSGHVDFAESTEEMAPLTEAEKKAKLEELRAKLAAKRAGASDQDKIDKKKNEVEWNFVSG